MIALVVTGLVVSLAYATTQAGLDTASRLGLHRDVVEREMAVRALITDALRHQVDGQRGGGEVFALSDRVAANGTSADSLRLTTRGVVAPLGASAPWSVSIWLVGDTLLVEGHPIDETTGAVPLMARLGGVVQFDAQLLGRGLAASWRGAWPERDVAPDAIALTLQRSAAAPVTIVVRRGLERAP
jgi:hypothetical protein